jgi:hypothetical protein
MLTKILAIIPAKRKTDRQERELCKLQREFAVAANPTTTKKHGIL